jgi:tetratricopeptide (TPR) repeat protein
LSGILIHLRDYQAAKAHAQQAVAICRRIRFARGLPAALLSLAHAEKWQGNLETACSYYEDALVGRSHMPPSTVINGLYGLGQARFRQGELVKAFAHFEEALKLARASRLLFRICEVAQDMVLVHIARNEFDGACARLRESLDSARQLGTPHFMAKAVAAAISLWKGCGKHEQAAVWVC